MSCTWLLHGLQSESFVFNLAKEEVYWVNENKRLPLLEINEGRIIFEGERSTLRINDKTTSKDVPIKFVVDRVTGKLDIQKVKAQASRHNICISKEKVI
jgi:hypothetical protein